MNDVKKILRLKKKKKVEVKKKKTKKEEDQDDEEFEIQLNQDPNDEQECQGFQVHLEMFSQCPVDPFPAVVVEPATSFPFEIESKKQRKENRQKKSQVQGKEKSNHEDRGG